MSLKNARPRSLLTTLSITFLVLLGLYVLVMYMMQDSDPDRPPIIISSGSVIVTSGGEWKDEGGKAYKQEFKGKSVKTFEATTGVGTLAGPCMVEGKTIVVTYGSNEITFTRKGKILGFGKDHAVAQFPTAAIVDNSTTGQLLVTTTDALVSFKNDKGDTCNVQGGTLTIQQKH